MKWPPLSLYPPTPHSLGEEGRGRHISLQLIWGRCDLHTICMNMHTDLIKALAPGI